MSGKQAEDDAQQNDGESSNGKAPGFDPGNEGSNPSSPTKSIFGMTPDERKAARENPEFVYTELQAWSKHEGNDGGFLIQWGAKGIGFGEIAFVKEGDKIKCYTECMSKEFVKKTVLQFLDKVEYIDL